MEALGATVQAEIEHMKGSLMPLNFDFTTKRRIFMWKPISLGEVTLLYFRVLVQVLGPSF